MQLIILVCVVLGYMPIFCNGDGLHCSECNSLAMEMHQKPTGFLDLTDEQLFEHQQCMFGHSIKPKLCVHSLNDIKGGVLELQNYTDTHHSTGRMHIHDVHCALIAGVTSAGNRLGVIRFCINKTLDIKELCAEFKRSPQIDMIPICDTCETENCNDATIDTRESIDEYNKVPPHQRKKANQARNVASDKAGTPNIRPLFSALNVIFITLVFMHYCCRPSIFH